MEEEIRSGHRPGYEISPEEVPHLNLVEAEEKMLYLRYVSKREPKRIKVIRYQYLIELLEARICLLRKPPGRSA